MSSSLPQTSPLGQPLPELCSVLALARVRPALLVFALQDWLLWCPAFANEAAPELQSVADSGQPGLRHRELAHSGALDRA
eukprot:12051325-Alexandrium_andersonii.AAC.1